MGEPFKMLPGETLTVKCPVYVKGEDVQFSMQFEIIFENIDGVLVETGPLKLTGVNCK